MSRLFFISFIISISLPYIFMAISMTKLYQRLDSMESETSDWIVLIIAIQVVILGLVWWILFHPFDEQELHNAIDNSRINIQDNIDTLSKKIDSKFWTLDAQLTVLQWRTDWTADNISSAHSWVTNVSNIQLVHYFAEVEICSDKYSSYKVKVDFYGINPRIESNRLLILDERYFSDYEAANVYLPIYDKNTDYDANLCSIRIISSSNK